MYLGPFVFWVAAPMVTAVRRYRHDLEPSFIWRVIVLAIGISVATALVAAFVNSLYSNGVEPVLVGILVLLFSPNPPNDGLGDSP